MQCTCPRFASCRTNGLIICDTGRSGFCQRIVIRSERERFPPFRPFAARLERDVAHRHALVTAAAAREAVLKNGFLNPKDRSSAVSFGDLSVIRLQYVPPSPRRTSS
jgi:hypothetical protein